MVFFIYGIILREMKVFPCYFPSAVINFQERLTLSALINYKKSSKTIILKFCCPHCLYINLPL